MSCVWGQQLFEWRRVDLSTGSFCCVSARVGCRTDATVVMPTQLYRSQPPVWGCKFLMSSRYCINIDVFCDRLFRALLTFLFLNGKLWFYAWVEAVSNVAILLSWVPSSKNRPLCCWVGPRNCRKIDISSKTLNISLACIGLLNWDE